MAYHLYTYLKHMISSSYRKSTYPGVTTKVVEERPKEQKSMEAGPVDRQQPRLCLQQKL
jgi:hypothetical protein